MVMPRSRSDFSLSITQAYLKEPLPDSWAIRRLNSFCLAGVSRETGSIPMELQYSLGMELQYSLASCCSKLVQPIFQVTTYPTPFQKWLGAAAPHLLVPPEILLPAGCWNAPVD